MEHTFSLSYQRNSCLQQNLSTLYQEIREKGVILTVTVVALLFTEFTPKKNENTSPSKIKIKKSYP